MKALFVITRTNEMHKHMDSFTCLDGNEVSHYMYTFERKRPGWATGEELDKQVYEAVGIYRPDFMVYVGTCGGNIPSPQVFRKIRHELCPTVHFCSDAADPPWWPLFNEYEENHSFNVQVALDGPVEWPLRKTGISALTPLDPAVFHPKPYDERTVEFGFAGDPGGIAIVEGKPVGRALLSEPMLKNGLKVRERDRRTGDLEIGRKTYQEAADFLCDTKITPNFPGTGSWTRMHVKGRVVEAGWARTALLEKIGSPAASWFEAGADFLEWTSPDECLKFVRELRENPEKGQYLGARLHDKVSQNHNPLKFWNRIFSRL